MALIHAILIVGCIPLAIIAFIVNTREGNGILKCSGVLMAVGDILSVSSGVRWFEGESMPFEDNVSMMAAGWLLCIVGLIVLVFIVYINHSKTKISREQAQRKQKLIKFYDDCLKSGITKCVSQKEIQKATLIAERESMQFSNISDLFDEAKKCKDESTKLNEAQALEKALVAQKEEEERKLSELIHYASLSGRNKRIKMLQDQYNDYLKSAKTLRDGAIAVMQASQLKEKEGNWAIMGGIADAIAGPAAGIATALSEQAKTAQENAKIRAQNQRNREVFAPVMMTAYSGAAQKESVAKRIGSKKNSIRNRRC